MRWGRRWGHAAALLGKYILVVGGNGGQEKCEKFDVLKAVVTDLPDFDEFWLGVTLVSVNARFAFVLGGDSEY
jgi:hypothetical protein